MCLDMNQQVFNLRLACGRRLYFEPLIEAIWHVILSSTCCHSMQGVCSFLSSKFPRQSWIHKSFMFMEVGYMIPILTQEEYPNLSLLHFLVNLFCFFKHDTSNNFNLLRAYQCPLKNASWPSHSPTRSHMGRK